MQVGITVSRRLVEGLISEEASESPLEHSGWPLASAWTLWFFFFFLFLAKNLWDLL